MDLKIIIRGTYRALALALLMTAPIPAPAELPQMPEPAEVLALPEKPAGAHWVWLGDFQNGLYARSILYNADSGDVLGMIDTGWEGIKPDFPKSGDVFYNNAMYMSRAFRGERTDVITAYDRRTLNPVREILVPPKAIRGWPDINHTALSDDDRFMWIQFFTPASSIGVADLKGNAYVGEIETAGCAHVMPAGPRRFFTLCGDGSVLAVTVDDNGRETTRKRYPHFFDADADPLHGSGTRSGDVWYFASHRGQIHEIDVGGAELEFGKPWTVAERDGELTWVPGPLMQTVAVHHATQRLYVLMRPSDLKPKGGGTDFHRADASEIWVFDLATRKRSKRVTAKHPASALAVSQDAKPLLYAAAIQHGIVTVYDEASGEARRDISIPLFPTLIQPVE